MRRWAINLFCLFSLLIFTASVALWVRSEFVSDRIGYWIIRWDLPARPDISVKRGYEIAWNWGNLGFHYHSHDFNADDRPLALWQHERDAPDRVNRSPFGGPLPPRVSMLGVRFATHTWPDGPGWDIDHDLIVPLWLFLPFGIPPILWLRRWRREGGRGRGFPVSAEEGTQRRDAKNAEKSVIPSPEASG